MKAMLLAAGRGERMRRLTDNTAKPLLTANGISLIDFHLVKLAKAGFSEIVINICWQADKIIQHIGDGSRFGLSVAYSHEVTALETGGGIANAIDLLGSDPFLLISSDIWTDCDFSGLSPLYNPDLAHLVLVDNPPHHTSGDFSLHQRRVRKNDLNGLTYSGIGVFRPEMFHAAINKRMPLRDLLIPAIDADLVSGQHYRDRWIDIGTPERLEELDQLLKSGH